MRTPWLISLLHLGASAYAAPPPDTDGKFRDWFQSLVVPGVPGTMCCSVADCRMVEARWDQRAQHHKAKVIRDVFSNALRHSHPCMKMIEKHSRQQKRFGQGTGSAALAKARRHGLIYRKQGSVRRTTRLVVQYSVGPPSTASSMACSVSFHLRQPPTNTRFR
jgi:hypothetical protein